MSRKKRNSPTVNAGSMADIAFLLLVFFLVTTTMDSDKGLRVRLPPYIDLSQPPPKVPLNKKNVLEVLVNKNDQLLVEGKILVINDLTNLAKKHITNRGKDPDFSESPSKAIVSLMNDRKTSYKRYLEVYNELLRAYHEVRNEYANNKFNRDYTDLMDVDKKTVKDEFPIIISEAEPIGIKK